MFIISKLFPVDYYKEGLDYYNKQDYAKALYYFNNVKPEDKNYAETLLKIQHIKPIVDSIQQTNCELEWEKIENSKTSPNNNNENKENKEILPAVGQTHHLGTLSYKIDKCKFKKFVGGLFSLKKADGVFLIVTLTVTNEGKQQIIIDDSFFKLIDDNGAEYEYSPDAALAINVSDFPGETFLGMTVNPHITKKAKVVFEVPSKKIAYKLVLSNGLSDNKLILDLNE